MMFNSFSLAQYWAEILNVVACSSPFMIVDISWFYVANYKLNKHNVYDRFLRFIYLIIFNILNFFSDSCRDNFFTLVYL